MNGDDAVLLIWGIGSLMLLSSALISRRLLMGQTIKMALAWVAIFAAMFAVFSFRAELVAVWQRVHEDITGTSNQKTLGKSVYIVRGDDGHFSVSAMVNGINVTFMIDTGASMTSISSVTAKSSHIPVNYNGYPVVIETANGRTLAYRSSIDELNVGSSIRLSNHKIFVSDSFGEMNVLGMNFLDTLQSWRVEGSVMTLTAR